MPCFYFIRVTNTYSTHIDCRLWVYLGRAGLGKYNNKWTKFISFILFYFAQQHSKLALKRKFWRKKNNKTKRNVYSIRYSQAVTHPSTDLTRRCLTSVIGREPVFSTWCGRRHECSVKACLYMWACMSCYADGAPPSKMRVRECASTW